MTGIDRIAVVFLVLMSLVLSFLSSLAIKLALESDTAAKRDVTTVEIDVQTLARTKSIQERLNTLDRQIEMFIDTSTDAHANSRRHIISLDQRIADLEAIIREPAPSPPPTRDPVEPTTPPDVPATLHAAPRRRFPKFRDLEEGEYFTDADGWWLVCLASIAVIVAACVAMLYVSYYTLTH